MLETWDLSDIMSEWWVNWLFQLEAYPAYASSELNKFIILNTHLILRRREIRGRGRLSVGRDPETCSVKILPNQRGLHPKCRPTVLCQLQSVHWLACPLPKLQNYNHNYQNMRGNRCQVIPKWPSSDPRDRNMQLILSDCCTTIQDVILSLVSGSVGVNAVSRAPQIAAWLFALPLLLPPTPGYGKRPCPPPLFAPFPK